MSHPHYVHSLSGNIICVTDLGIDQVLFYERGKDWEEIGCLPLEPGCGPRHIEFDRTRQIIYILNELSCDIVVVKYLNRYRCFEKLQSVNTLTSGFNGNNTGAAVRLSTDGRFLYASNRGSDKAALAVADGWL